MRPIDADALMNASYTLQGGTEEYHFGFDDGYRYFQREVVGVAPTIDAVPVVRCKDCKYYQTGMFCEKWADLHPHAEEYPMVCSNGFCHYSERKDGAEDV